MPIFELRWGDEDEVKVADAISIQKVIRLIVASGYSGDIEIFYAEGGHLSTHKGKQEEQKDEFTIAEAM